MKFTKPHIPLIVFDLYGVTVLRGGYIIQSNVNTSLGYGLQSVNKCKIGLAFTYYMAISNSKIWLYPILHNKKEKNNENSIRQSINS